MPTDPKELIASIPAAAEAVAARQDVTATELLNAPNDWVPRNYMATKRQLYVDFGLMRGVAIMQGLRDAAKITAPEHPLFAYAGVLGEVASMLESSEGLDLGRAEDAAQLKPLLVSASIATEEEMDKLLAHGRRPVGAWEKAFGHDVTASEIADLYRDARLAEDKLAGTQAADTQLAAAEAQRAAAQSAQEILVADAVLAEARHAVDSWDDTKTPKDLASSGVEAWTKHLAVAIAEKDQDAIFQARYELDQWQRRLKSAEGK